MSEAHPHWLSLANGLTGLRLISIPLMVWLIVTASWGLAGVFFTLAAITDLLDGPLARRSGKASPMGGLFDHGTDALYVASCLAALAWVGLVNGWLPGLVLLAFLQYTIDSRALAGKALKASVLGRYNGIAYFVMVGIPVIRNALGLGWPGDLLIAVLAWLLVLTTLISMTDRAVAFLR
ncbi:MAG: CDP-alcohol phosphatidyltransferase family protein [Pseudomonadota bacterium]